ncbi:MAG: glycosyltransferase family 39 protein [Acetobacteraceae bacterium]|nr:glycosyltransferase family 39 protein [Acetobacteraceae bacterium]
MTPDASARLRPLDLALLAALALALFLPGQAGLPPLDRDESRYAVAVTQMVTTGDLIDIRYQDQPRWLQPAGIYWLQSLAVTLSGGIGQISAHRLVSLAGAVLSVLLAAWLGARLYGRQAGIAAGAMLAACLVLNVEARMAKIDATMLAAVLAAQSALLLLYLDRAARPALAAAVLWVALGVGLMLKGPIPTMVTVLTAAAISLWNRDAAWLRRLRAHWGVPLMLAIVLPWLLAIVIRTEGAFLSEAIGHSMLGKVADGQQGHGAPPGYHLLAFSVAFWPASLFFVLALPWVWANRHEKAVRALLCWVVPTWVVFEIVATKLPHYTLPTYPALAILAGAALSAGALGLPAGRWRWLGRVILGVWLVVAAALALFGPVLAFLAERRVNWLAVAAAVATVGLTALALRLLGRAEMRRALAASLGAAAVVWVVTFGHTLPGIRALWLSPRIAEAAAAAAPCRDPLLITQPYHEPSLVFLHGPYRTRLVTGAAQAAAAFRAAPCAVAAMGEREEAAFLAALGEELRRAAVIEGRNYSNGRFYRIAILVRPE